jgi:hypothetical protein
MRSFHDAVTSIHLRFMRRAANVCVSGMRSIDISGTYMAFKMSDFEHPHMYRSMTADCSSGVFPDRCSPKPFLLPFGVRNHAMDYGRVVIRLLVASIPLTDVSDEGCLLLATEAGGNEVSSDEDLF